MQDKDTSRIAPDALSNAVYIPYAGNRAKFVQGAIAAAYTEHPHFVLVGHPNFALLGWIVAKTARVPYITFVYGIDVWQPMPRMRRWALQHSELIISISHFTAGKAVICNRLDKRKVRVLSNCLDPCFSERPAAPQGTENLSLLTVARLSLAERYKGVDMVIRSLPYLLALYPNLRYDVVGDGDWRAELEALAESMRVRHAVCFHGQVPEHTLRQRYAAATLFVMPSRGEGFGFVFLEAMANGLPVVAGSTDAAPEVVVDGVTGRIVNPTSPEAIASVIAGLLADATLRKRMGDAGKKRVQEHFSFGSFQNQLSQLLVEVRSSAD